MKYVLIGNSAAAIAAIEGIRSVDPQGEIVVFSSEAHPCYGRPTISYYLKGDIKQENMHYRPSDFYQTMHVDLKFRTVTGVQPAQKTVTLDDGTRESYDRLLVATGSRPFVPPMKGLETVKKAFTFMTYDDMTALEDALTSQSRVLVIGAGLIGLKCVEGILKRVCSVTVVDMATRILPSILQEEGASLIQRQLEGEGVNFILGSSVAQFEGGTATLTTGETVDFDILVLAVGVRPNVKLVQEAGGTVNRGIVVDDAMQTSLPDVYAAGDCAEGYDSSIGEKRVLALWPNACFQGRCAGLNMAGKADTFTKGIPLNAIGFFGSHILSAGVYEGECHSRITDTTLKQLFIKDGRLVGFMLINDFLNAGIYTSLVREKTDLSTVDVALLLQKPQLLAFSPAVRAQKLGRRV